MITPGAAWTIKGLAIAFGGAIGGPTGAALMGLAANAAIRAYNTATAESDGPDANHSSHDPNHGDSYGIDDFGC